MRASLTFGLGHTRATAAGVASELRMGVDNSIAPSEVPLPSSEVARTIGDRTVDIERMSLALVSS
jgi:hypothetical protein